MRLKQFTIEFVRFSRLHTIIGTTLSVTVLFFMAASETQVASIPWALLLITLTACLGANIYIVGLNQITDIEIDKINKPYLPLASGAFSLKMGYALISSGFLASLLLAAYSGKYLLLTVGVSLVLGTAYSLPPLRLKRFHFWAAFCIIAIRGLVVNIFLYLHFQYQINGWESLPPSIVLLTITMFFYGLVIAWFKDVPDMQGDALHHIKTLSIHIGAKKVLLVGNLLLSILLITLAFISFMLPMGFNAPIMFGAHSLMLIALWFKRSKMDLFNQTHIRKYYLFIWLLFFLEYIFFGIATGI